MLHFSLFMMLLATNANVDGARWSDSFDSIRKTTATIHSIESNFTQKKTLKILAQPMVSKGRFAFMPPDSLRWEYQTPLESLLLMDHGKIARYSRRDGKYVADAAEQLEAMRIVMDEIKLWLTGDYDRSQSFSASIKNHPLNQVELTPKNSSLQHFIQRVVITLDEKPGVVKSVEIIESPNASTFIEFLDVRLNSSLAKDTFSQP
jgi:outer membrane lipoprotein-sorting protein